MKNIETLPIAILKKISTANVVSFNLKKYPLANISPPAVILKINNHPVVTTCTITGYRPDMDVINTWGRVQQDVKLLTNRNLCVNNSFRSI